MLRQLGNWPRLRAARKAATAGPVRARSRSRDIREVHRGSWIAAKVEL